MNTSISFDGNIVTIEKLIDFLAVHYSEEGTEIQKLYEVLVKHDRKESWKMILPC